MPKNKYSDQISTPKGSGPSGTMNQKSEEGPQAECDQRGPGYDNKTPQSWITGANEDATTKPGFDHSPPRSKMRRN